MKMQTNGNEVETENSTQKKQGDDAMNSSVLSYTKLDLHSLGKKNVKIVSSEEALKDVIPMKWEEDTIQGRTKVTVTKRNS